MTNFYEITKTIYQIIDFTDEDMIANGYEEPITDVDRREYLMNQLEDNVGSFSMGDIEIHKFDPKIGYIKENIQKDTLRRE